MAVFWVVVPCSLKRRWTYTRLHGATTQKTAIFILAAVRTSSTTKTRIALYQNYTLWTSPPSWLLRILYNLLHETIAVLCWISDVVWAMSWLFNTSCILHVGITPVCSRICFVYNLNSCAPRSIIAVVCCMFSYLLINTKFLQELPDVQTTKTFFVDI
jgi:hypothetical protein